MKAASAEKMKNMDERAIREFGISSTVLMERAAAGFAEAAYQEALKKRAGEKRPLRIAAFCGPGNNGGDGVAAARLLLEREKGTEIRIFLAGNRERMTPDCREMEERLVKCGGQLEDFVPEDAGQREWFRDADVILDALFGVGLNKEIRGAAAEAVRLMNESPAPVASADIASGLAADTGEILGTAVEADVTVTFTFPKPGHFLGEGARCTGRLKVCPIGIPEELQEEMKAPDILTKNEAAAILPKRPWNGHKGTFGKVYAVGGSIGLTGAPVFAARAAARTGSGLVFLGVPEAVYPITAAMCLEAMPSPLPDRDGGISAEAFFRILDRMNTCDAGLIGPGLGRSRELVSLVCRLLEQVKAPLVLDADALYAVRNRKEVLKARAEKGLVTVLTPHEGEFAYLGGDLSKGRQEAARSFAEIYGCILVLKGPRTLIAAPDGRMYLNTTGNSGMAKGGSGDVLSGMILSLLGQGVKPLEAAALAVWLHGSAGDLCKEELGEFGMLPSDMIERIPAAIRYLQEE